MFHDTSPQPVKVTTTTDHFFHKFHDLDTEIDLYRITSGSHGVYATGLYASKEL